MTDAEEARARLIGAAVAWKEMPDGFRFTAEHLRNLAADIQAALGVNERLLEAAIALRGRIRTLNVHMGGKDTYSLEAPSYEEVNALDRAIAAAKGGAK